MLHVATGPSGTAFPEKTADRNPVPGKPGVEPVTHAPRPRPAGWRDDPSQTDRPIRFTYGIHASHDCPVRSHPVQSAAHVLAGQAVALWVESFSRQIFQLQPATTISTFKPIHLPPTDWAVPIVNQCQSRSHKRGTVLRSRNIGVGNSSTSATRLPIKLHRCRKLNRIPLSHGARNQSPLTQPL